MLSVEIPCKLACLGRLCEEIKREGERGLGSQKKIGWRKHVFVTSQLVIYLCNENNLLFQLFLSTVRWSTWEHESCPSKICRGNLHLYKLAWRYVERCGGCQCQRFVEHRVLQSVDSTDWKNYVGILKMERIMWAFTHTVLQCVSMCWSVLQCVVACYSTDQEDYAAHQGPI